MTRFDDPAADALAARQLEELFLAYRKAVVAYVRRRVPAESVDDVVAETFLVACRRLERVPADSPLPWLLAVARNLSARQRRGVGRRHSLAMRLREGTIISAAELPSIQEPTGPIAGAIGRLGERDREALELVAVDGLKPREAAAVLGVSSTAFRTRLHRAKHRLRRLLEEQRQERPTEPSPRPLKAKETGT